MTLDLILHDVVVLHACAVAMIRSSHTLIDMIYCTAETKSTPASVQGVASINRSIRISLLHNVVKRV
jgi:TRAP-type mannitol/chloroaromatic compound transport system permease small subunit